MPLQPGHIRAALDLVREHCDAGRRVFLHCRLGLLRSALIAAHWLVESSAADDLEQARRDIRAREPEVVL